MKKIDMDSYSRRAVFEHMMSISQPFYSVTFRQDVTELKRFTKERGISFYYALTCLVTLAVNSVPEMRMLIREGELFIYDERLPSFTDMGSGSDAFYIVTMPCVRKETTVRETVERFCRDASERSIRQCKAGIFLDQELESDNLIFISCLPWIDITAITNEREFDKLDSVPRIAWGKYTEENGRVTLGMSIEVNHIFVDGIHIGRFSDALTNYINTL